MAIDHAFIERKRAIIAQIERDAAHLPNPFLGLNAPTRATRKHPALAAPYARRPSPFDAQGVLDAWHKPTRTTGPRKATSKAPTRTTKGGKR